MDIELHYEEAGSADAFPLILLHGNGESGAYFKNQIPYFSGRFRVIALDTRGHGRSPRGAAPFSIKQFAEDLNEFMEEKGIACAAVLGFSDGANIAMEFALKHGEKLKALILNGGNLNTTGVKRKVQIPIEIGYRMAKRFAGKSPEAAANAEMLSLMVGQPNIAPEELSRITVPTLVICGTNDMIKDSHSRLIAQSIPNASFSVIKGDHFIAGKKWEAFNREVDVFLKNIGL